MKDFIIEDQTTVYAEGTKTIHRKDGPAVLILCRASENSIIQCVRNYYWNGEKVSKDRWTECVDLYVQLFGEEGTHKTVLWGNLEGPELFRYEMETMKAYEENQALLSKVDQLEKELETKIIQCDELATDLHQMKTNALAVFRDVLNELLTKIAG